MKKESSCFMLKIELYKKLKAIGTFVVILIAVVLLCSCSRSSSPDDNAISHFHEDFAEPVQDIPLAQRSYELTLGFTGDVCLADNYIPMQHLASMGSSNISDGIDLLFLEQMNKEDVLWVNNEFVYSDRGEALPGKAWTFRAPTQNVSYLHDMGADIVGIANNHVFDFGEESFADTLVTLQNAGIPYVGGGWDERGAYAPVYIEKDDVTIAYVAASRAELTIYTLEAQVDKPGIAWCYDNTKFLASIREAAEHADFVIALPHWGTEHSTELEEVQIDSAHAYIDAGADIVIGAHPHILQGIEYYNGHPICYSLGNFWFDDYDIDTVLAEIRIRGTRIEGQHGLGENPVIELVLYPGRQSGMYTKWATDDAERKRIFNGLEGLSAGIAIRDDGVVISVPQTENNISDLSVE